MLGIIGAMEMEVEGIRQKIEDCTGKNISGTTFYSGTIGGTPVCLAKCGEGKVNAALCAQTMVLTYMPDYIINTGVAGGLLPAMRVCDCAVASHVCQHDFDLRPLGTPLGMLPVVNEIYIKCNEELASALASAANKLCGGSVFEGIIATGDQFISEDEKARFLAEEFGAIACEMEGGAIGHVCSINNIPFAVLRTISDGGNDEASLSFEEFAALAADKSVNIILQFIQTI
ncbi:MAG: 5'-methylthioadenosine/adenosylhomocysteine nucleosidase [Oscillospiraceae bacterium]|jgi:adenosylhomocysteine nucleosidase|nr:5'-methylthioadenosine/adenosylhomocysteine nucleosidase [Oscillospiraceae bacterium]